MHGVNSGLSDSHLAPLTNGTEGTGYTKLRQVACLKWAGSDRQVSKFLPPAPPGVSPFRDTQGLLSTFPWVLQLSP